MVAVIVGLVWGTRTGIARLRWVFEDRPPDEDEQRRTLRVPQRLVRVQAVIWVGAAAFFAVGNSALSGLGGLKIGITELGRTAGRGRGGTYGLNLGVGGRVK